jgi:hypothetical protein
MLDAATKGLPFTPLVPATPGAPSLPLHPESAEIIKANRPSRISKDFIAFPSLSKIQYMPACLNVFLVVMLVPNSLVAVDYLNL